MSDHLELLSHDFGTFIIDILPVHPQLWIMIGKVTKLITINTSCGVCRLHLRDLACRNDHLAFTHHTGWRLQMPQTKLFMGDYPVRPSGYKHLWPQYETRYTSAPCKLQNDSWKAALHASKAPSLCQSMFNNFHRNFYWPSCHFLLYFPPPSTQFLWWLFEDLSSTPFFFFFALFLTRQILREADVKTRQSRDVKNVNTFFIFFYCPEGRVVMVTGRGGGVVHWAGRWGL